MIKKYNWPLGISTMTWKDKLKIGKFLFTEEQWTAGRWVENYERIWGEYSRAPFVVAVSSGSTANHLIALRRKEEVKADGRNKVLFNVVNWISSVSPFIHIGFEPVFVDISDNLCPSVEQIREKLRNDPNIGTVFYTTLLGYSAPIEELLKVCEEFGVKLYLDNCEASFSWYRVGEPMSYHSVSFNNITTSSTSCYISHYTSGGTELGIIFCQTEEEYDWYRMMRNHGMTRNVPEKYRNYDVDKMFDFHLMGTNFRSSNLQCYMASLDFERSENFSKLHRTAIEQTLLNNLDPKKFTNRHYHHPDLSEGFCPLSIPIVINKDCKDKNLIYKIKAFLDVAGVGQRPVVGSNLLRHTAFKQYGNSADYPEAEYIHFQGIYIGLHSGVSYKMAMNLTDDLNRL